MELKLEKNADVGATFKVNDNGTVNIGSFAVSTDGGTDGGYIGLTGASEDGIGSNYTAVHKPSGIEFRDGVYGESKCTIGSQVGAEKSCWNAMHSYNGDCWDWCFCF